MPIRYLALLPMLATAALLSPPTWAQVPVFAVTPVESTIKFNVKASVPIAGNFDKWDAAATFTSQDVTTAVLDIKIQAASVNTGSGMKNNKLKGKNFFNVEQHPLITFKSTKSVKTGPTTFDVPGAFTIRGVSKQETLTLTVSGEGTGSGDHGHNGLRPRGRRDE
jgi:polyisoprenoid-binding protein YceI